MSRNKREGRYAGKYQGMYFRYIEKKWISCKVKYLPASYVAFAMWIGSDK